MALEEHRIPEAPEAMYYIPDFISQDEEQSILHSIPDGKWISLSKRRLQAVPARLSATNTLLAAPLPPWLLEPIVPRFRPLGLFRDAPHGVNHCLINEYLPGQGIMPHEDGAAYHPVVATVSLGGALVLDVTAKPSSRPPDGHNGPLARPTWRVLQEPRSLLLTTADAYTETLHGIAEITEDTDLGPTTIANWGQLGDMQHFQDNGGRNTRSTRISLTYRDVKKVSSIGSRLFGKPKS
ncbi:Alpha-ketoglutarate-dependent dioxygenase alkB 6 [Teratosphaeria destructans]|uniref:Alpha-ketoglutarate-dependent dioxygenase alkB 6 n=1 Tax=Teratosphaeria destructans TaxID=418781 RepID=A0A9W7STX7_9PEZI|nr:Alpha-ketoglutarate-dependent dioxygenase alkB 6 [Teratosphaeria destructans]